MVKYGLKRLNIELTSRCNYSCVGCPTHSLRRGKGDIDPKLFLDIFKEVGNDVEKIYLWNYGESLLHPDIEEMLEGIRKYGCQKVLSTNGWKLEDFDDLKFLTTLDELLISINGLSEETYKIHQRGGDFNKVIRGIKKTSVVLKDSKTRYIMQFIASKHNLGEIKRLRAFAEEMGFKELFLKTFNVMDMNQETFDEFVPVETRYSRYSKNNPITIPQLSEKARPCQEWMVINWDGSVNPCCWDYKGAYVLGNVREQGVYGVWNSDKCVEHRKEIEENNFHEFCIDCLVNTYIPRTKS
jgi:radical SAM protein with 4Fe4S-binding SPASM domain